MAITVYKKTALTGGAATALDGIDGAGLLDGDFAFVTLSGVLYVYILDDDDAGVESSPNRITPDANPGNKRWLLQETYLKGVTSSVAELNILDGVTASAAELNLVDGSVAGTAVASKALVLGADKNVDTIAVAANGLKIGAGAGTAVTATAAELNHSVGVTSAIQTQLNAKAPAANPTFTGTVVLPSTTSVGNVSATELGYLDGVTSAIQTQLNAKAVSIGPVVGYAENTAAAIYDRIHIEGTLASPTDNGIFNVSGSLTGVKTGVSGGTTVVVDYRTAGSTGLQVSLVLPAGTYVVFATGSRSFDGDATYASYLTAMAIRTA